MRLQVGREPLLIDSYSFREVRFGVKFEVYAKLGVCMNPD
jgi:hypothetical protein